MLVSRRFLLNRQKMLGLAARLEEAGDEARSWYVPARLPLAEVTSWLEKAPGLPIVPENLTELVARSETGAIIFWGSSLKYLVLPPFPIMEKHIAQGYDVTPLRSLLQRDLTIGLILIRLGAYAIGVCQGEKLFTSKVGTGLVHARHKKGGSSQRRFERHREKQIEYFLTRVCTRARERLEPHARSLDYITYGGARTTILSLRKRCSFLRQFDEQILPPLLEIQEPRRAVLEAAITRVWSSSVIEWRENEAAL